MEENSKILQFRQANFSSCVPLCQTGVSQGITYHLKVTCTLVQNSRLFLTHCQLISVLDRQNLFVLEGGEEQVFEKIR